MSLEAAGKLKAPHQRVAVPRRFWQCQPQGYVASADGPGGSNSNGSKGKTITITATMTLKNVPFTAVNTGALAAGMQCRMAAELASANGGSVIVTATATPGTASGRRLAQSGTISTLVTFTITIQVSPGVTEDFITTLAVEAAENALTDPIFLTELLRDAIEASVLALLDLLQLVADAIKSVSVSAANGPSPVPSPSPAPGSGNGSPSPALSPSPSPVPSSPSLPGAYWKM